MFGLEADRKFGSHVFDPANGGAILWQHLFWFFGHPEVYIVAIPFFGIITEVIPVFSRKPVFGYRGMIYATLSIAALSSAVCAHHMFATGDVLQIGRHLRQRYAISLGGRVGLEMLALHNLHEHLGLRVFIAQFGGQRVVPPVCAAGSSSGVTMSKSRFGLFSRAASRPGLAGSPDRVTSRSLAPRPHRLPAHHSRDCRLSEGDGSLDR